jgi:hypothetical protein
MTNIGNNNHFPTERHANFRCGFGGTAVEISAKSLTNLFLSMRANATVCVVLLYVIDIIA